MLRKRFQNRRNVILSDREDSTFVLYVSTEEECLELSKILNSAFRVGTPKYDAADKICMEQFGFSISDVVAHGDGGPTKFTKLHSIDHSYITFRDITPQGKSIDKRVRSYKCFQNSDWKIRQFGLILHEDVESSWNCAMEVLKHPSHLILLKIEKEDKS